MVPPPAWRTTCLQSGASSPSSSRLSARPPPADSKLSAHSSEQVNLTCTTRQVLGISDIWIRGSVPLTNGSDSSFSDLRIQIFFFSIFFSYNLPTVLKIKFFNKICVKVLFCKLVSVAQHLNEKREGSGVVPVTNGYRPNAKSEFMKG
jgi:hypothetical protein